MPPITLPLTGKRCRCGALRDKATKKCPKCQARARYRRKTHYKKAARRRARALPGEPSTAKGHAVVTVSIPLVVIVGAIIYLAYRYMGLRVWQAVVCLIFGFLLAATAAAPEIRNLLTGLVQWLTKP